MFVLFGISTLKRGRGSCVGNCPICGRETVHAQAADRRWLTIFFVPVVPLGGPQHFLQCNICGDRVGTSPGQLVPGFAPGAGPAEISAWSTKQCPKCAETIKLEARFCRYCAYEFDEASIEQAKQRAALTSASHETQIRATSAHKRARVYGCALFPLALVTLFMGSATVFATREILAKPEFQTSIAGSIFALVFLVAIMLGVPLALTVLAWRRWRRNRKAARQLQLAVQTARATASPLLSPNRS